MVRALEGLEGVEQAQASHPEKKAVAVYDPALVTLEQMVEALRRAGYTACVDGQATRREADCNFEDKLEFKREDLVCYCFGFTRGDIERDVIQNGRSTIMAEIASEKKAGGCDCAKLNPRGR